MLMFHFFFIYRLMNDGYKDGLDGIDRLDRLDGIGFKPSIWVCPIFTFKRIAEKEPLHASLVACHNWCYML